MRLDTSAGAFNVRFFGDRHGTPVVLLHPLSSTGEIWAPFADRLAGHNWSVIAPDLPGSVATPVSIAGMAGAVAAIMTTLELGRAGVVGMSMGGCIAQQLTLDHPELVGQLVLADTTSNYGDDQVERWEERAEAAMAPDRESLRDFQTKRWFSETFRRAEPAECERVFRIFANVTGADHAACCRALGSFDVTARLGEIATPTLVLVGANDYATPPAMSQTLAAGITGAQLEVLPGVSHFAMIESHGAWDAAERHLGAGRSA